MYDDEEEDEESLFSHNFMREVVHGIMSVLTISSSHLYRYPYRNSSEAFRGDFKRIAGDMENSMNQIQFESHDRRTQ